MINKELQPGRRPYRPSRGDAEPEGDMDQDMSRQGHPIKPVIHMAFMDVPEAMAGTTSDCVAPQAKSKLTETDMFWAQTWKLIG